MPDSARIDHLPALEAAIWHELESAFTRKGHPWRLAVLATADGMAADARTVVLRDADCNTRELIFYTDARSPKLQQVEQQPEGTMVLWSQALGWQLRLRVHLSVETSGLKVSSRWARLKMTPAAQDYLSPLPPGSTLATDSQTQPQTQPPGHTPAPERSTREHFAVVTARVAAVDWLELHADGHRRAAFDDQGARWLVP